MLNREVPLPSKLPDKGKPASRTPKINGESTSTPCQQMRSRNPFAPLDAVTVYRTAEDAWTEGPRLPVGLLGPSAHVLGDRVLLIGGSVDGPWKPQTAQYSLRLDELP